MAGSSSTPADTPAETPTDTPTADTPSETPAEQRGRSQSRRPSPKPSNSVENGTTSATLDDAMRQPSTNVPDIVVIDSVPEKERKKAKLDLKQDLWLSTVDGRHQSPIIPIRCGPCAETFYVHKDVLRKSEYFRKALDGSFKEASAQAMDLPEEDPAIFSFIVAYLYEERFQPTRPAADALNNDAARDKGKGKAREGAESDSESGSSSDSNTSVYISGSDSSARSRRRAAIRRRRTRQQWEQLNRKQVGRHPIRCRCPQCYNDRGLLPCWNCGMYRQRPLPVQNVRRRGPNGVWRYDPPPPPPPGMPGVFRAAPLFPPFGGPPPPPPPMPAPRRRARSPRDRNRRRNRGSSSSRSRSRSSSPEPRMTEEETRTWSLTYELVIDVYVCADRYLMTEFKTCIADWLVDYMETAGMDGALPVLLEGCKKMAASLSENDTLLKKMFARTGFLLNKLWKNWPEETSRFWVEAPEVGAMVMKEMGKRREEEVGEDLPSMEAQWSVDTIITERRRRRVY